MPFRSKSEVMRSIRPTFKTVAGKDYESFEIYFGTDGHGKKIRAVNLARMAHVPCPA